MSSPRTSHALVVGISEYSHVNPLEFSVSDAHELATILTRPQYGYNVTAFYDEQATRSQLLNALQTLFLSDADSLLFYFSGHGASPQYGAYLCSVDATPNDPGIDLAFLSRLAASAARPGRTTTILLDCCHAGAMTFTTPNGPPALLKSPHVSDSFASLPEGHVLFAACRPNELAYESDSLGHGVFSYHLLLGLHGDAANESGQVTAASLHDYLSRSLDGNAIAQTIVYRGDIAGVFLLGQGFSPIRRPVSDSAQLKRTTQQARAHLDAFQKETGHSYAQRELWSQSGYKAACQRLRPVVNWFNNRERDYPELRNHKAFHACVEEVRAWQTRLGDIENVSHTPWGTVERRLGHGTFGTVYLLRTQKMRRSEPVAFKIYHGQDIRLQDKAARFRRGFEAMKMLDHPRILKVGELCECPLGFSMEYIEGPNFRDFTGTLEVGEQLQLLLTVAETIAHAHSRDVVHRDVKPENILLSERGGVWLPWLADFDLAWFSTASVVTRDAIGSAFYSAPEQIHKPRSNAARNPRVDQYAFGQLLFFGVTGSDPVQHANDNLEELRSRLRRWSSADAASATLQLYERATAWKQGERYNSVREICDELHRIILLAETDPQEQIETDRFIREVVFGLVGFSNVPQPSGAVFLSLSEKTQIEIEVRSDQTAVVSLRFHLERLGTLTMEGLDHDAARRKLSTRIDGILQRFPGTIRKPGNQGTYQVFVTPQPLAKTMRGVEEARRILSRVVEAVDTA